MTQKRLSVLLVVEYLVFFAVGWLIPETLFAPFLALAVLVGLGTAVLASRVRP